MREKDCRGTEKKANERMEQKGTTLIGILDDERVGTCKINSGQKHA